MTVRVNKSAFNIRERLSELERPIGVKGNELMRAETAQDARDLVSAGRKNIIINGDMKIHQRGGTITATGSSSSFYTLDRWKTWCYPSAVSAVFTIQQATSNPPPGFHNYLRWTTTTAYAVSGNSASFFDIQQLVEGNNLKGIDIGKSTAKPLTLSFWVRSSIAGKYTVTTTYSGANPASYGRYYYVNSANTWEYKTITLPPHTATANGESAGTSYGINLSWNMGMGSSYATTNTTEGYYVSKYELGGSVRIIETTNATFDLTGVQLEVGKNATEFEHRSIGEELALCQRYFRRLTPVSNNAGGGWSDNYYRYGFGVANATNNVHVQVVHPVTMRTNAIFTFSAAADFNLWNGTFYSVTSIGMGSYGAGGAVLSISATVPNKEPLELIANNRQTGYLDFNAEL